MRRLQRLDHNISYNNDLYPIGNHIECGCVQDPYTMRCIPQVHGVVNDTIDFVKGIITTEINSALDNPVSFVITSPLCHPITSSITRWY